MRQFKKAFTLLEIFIVLGLLAIIASFVLPSFKGLRDEADLTRARTELAVLQTALESYYSERNVYPGGDYQQELIYGAQNKLINRKYYDPFQAAASEYLYWRSSDGRYYLLLSYGINRSPDLEYLSRIDLAAGTLELSGVETDDLLVTNLQII